MDLDAVFEECLIESANTLLNGASAHLPLRSEDSDNPVLQLSSFDEFTWAPVSSVGDLNCSLARVATVAKEYIRT